MSVIIGCEQYNCKNNARSAQNKIGDICRVDGCVILKKVVVDGVDFLRCDEFKPKETKEVEDVNKWD